MKGYGSISDLITIVPMGRGSIVFNAAHCIGANRTCPHVVYTLKFSLFIQPPIVAAAEHQENVKKKLTGLILAYSGLTYYSPDKFGKFFFTFS